MDMTDIADSDFNTRSLLADPLIFGRDVSGYASPVTALRFLGGIHLISLCIIGECMSRLCIETKLRCLHLLQDIYQKGRHAEGE